MRIDRRHHRVLALDGEFHRRLAHGVGLLHVGLGGDVARGALQVVRHAPVVLVAETFLDDGGHHRCDTAELGMAEGVACRPWSARNLPSGLFTPSDTTTVQ